MADRADFEQFYAQHSRSVYRRALRVLGDKEGASDATQEVFERAMAATGATGHIPRDPTATAWLYRVTTNLCLNRLRDRVRQDNLLASKFPSERLSPAMGETRTVVGDLLSRLPEELQDVAVYYFVDELTYDEIAPLLGISKRTVSSRLAAFRTLVAKLFPEARSGS